MSSLKKFRTFARCSVTLTSSRPRFPDHRSTSINIGLHGFHDIPWMASRFEGNGKLWTLVFDVVTWVQDMAAWQPGPLWDELTWDGPIISGQGTLPALPKTLSRSHGPRSGYHGLHINLIKAQYSTHRGRYWGFSEVFFSLEKALLLRADLSWTHIFRRRFATREFWSVLVKLKLCWLWNYPFSHDLAMELSFESSTSYQNLQNLYESIDCLVLSRDFGRWSHGHMMLKGWGFFQPMPWTSRVFFNQFLSISGENCDVLVFCLHHYPQKSQTIQGDAS